MRGRHHEAVAGLGLEPLLHLVGDRRSGAHEAGALEERGPVAGQVGQGHRVSADVLLEVLHQTTDADTEPISSSVIGASMANPEKS